MPKGGGGRRGGSTTIDTWMFWGAENCTSVKPVKMTSMPPFFSLSMDGSENCIAFTTLLSFFLMSIVCQALTKGAIRKRKTYTTVFS